MASISGHAADFGIFGQIFRYVERNRVICAESQAIAIIHIDG
jgi:hypothetical protein